MVSLKGRYKVGLKVMIRIALVEDDSSCKEQTVNYADRYAKENGVEVKIDCFGDGLEFLEKYSSDYAVVFMDIEMPYMNGLSVAKKLREKDEYVPLIFMTQMAQYAIKGYEVNAIDYVVKPVAYGTFSDKLKKAVKANEKYVDYDFTVAKKDGKLRLQTSKIYYVEVMNHKLVYHTVDGNVENSGSLSALERELVKYNFSRCNTCYLVNLRFVTALNENTVWVGSDALAVSRSRKKSFFSDVAAYRGGGK